MAKKHYRAVKRKLDLNSPKGMFITNHQKSKLIFFSCIIIGLIFVKALLLGYILGSKKR